MKKNVLLYVGLALIALALVAILFGRANAPEEGNEHETPEGGEAGGTVPATSELLRAGEHAIFVAEQKPGESITVHTLYLGGDGYVVIHEDSNGTPGPILGASPLLHEGVGNNLAITLSRATQDGEALYAMLHKDNGDGQFNPQQDDPFVDSQGNIVMMRFEIDSNAPDNPEIAI